MTTFLNIGTNGLPKIQRLSIETVSEPVQDQISNHYTPTYTAGDVDFLASTRSAVTTCELQN